MKLLAIALLLTASFAAHAENYIPVGDGFYSGTGTWTDNSGAKGTWSMVHQITKLGLHHEFSAQFSDGRQYSGSVDEVFGANSTSQFIEQIAGQSVTVGTSVSSPKTYQTTLSLSPTEAITEFGFINAKGLYQRTGSITESQTGRVTFLSIKLRNSR